MLKEADKLDKYLIPIIASHSLWDINPILKKWQVIPKKPNDIEAILITDWKEQSKAYSEIVRAINKVLPPPPVEVMETKGGADTQTANNNQPNNRRDMTNQSLFFENGYALLIGIAYKYWKIGDGQLAGTLKDVEDLKAHFTNPTKAAYKPENVIALTAENATKQGILAALDGVGA